MLITIENLNYWKACCRREGECYDEFTLKERLGERAGFTLEEVLAATDIPLEHRLWVLLHVEILPLKKLALCLQNIFLRQISRIKRQRIQPRGEFRRWLNAYVGRKEAFSTFEIIRQAESAPVPGVALLLYSVVGKSKPLDFLTASAAATAEIWISDNAWRYMRLRMPEEEKKALMLTDEKHIYNRELRNYLQELSACLEE